VVFRGVPTLCGVHNARANLRHRYELAMQQDKLCNARNLLRGARGHKAGALQRFEA